MLINAAMLVSILSICHQLFKDTGLNPASPMRHRVVSGLIFGMLGIVLIRYSMAVSVSEARVDFRNIAVVLSVFYGGPVSVAITSIMIGYFRILYYGVKASSVLGMLISVPIGIGCMQVFSTRWKLWKKWSLSVLLAQFITSLAFVYLIPDTRELVYVLSYYLIGSLIVSIVVYRYVRYLEAANKLFRRLKQEATKDFLTGLNNVRQFDKLFNHALENAKARNERLCLLTIDIDFFKKVNDTYGHPEGDFVLKELGSILLEHCRSFDIVSRNGGEEFSVILLDCSLERAAEVAERIRRAVEEHVFILPNGVCINVTVSIGVASYPETLKTLEKLIEQADTALYAAKRSGRNRVVLSEPVS